MDREDIPAAANYATTGNLLSRVALHGFASNPNWSDWLWERESPRHSDLARPARILDVGCGPGGLWADRLDINPAWSITLADTSPAMLDAAHTELGDRYRYVLADIQVLPFDDGAFDVVIANHMLYHVPDRPTALAEVARVLSSGGMFHCSTNGRGHLAELAALAPATDDFEDHAERFGLETGPAQLEPYFSDIRVEHFDTHLAVPHAEPVMAYIRSAPAYRGEDLSAARDAVQSQIDRRGAFHITSRPGLISARSA